VQKKHQLFPKALFASLEEKGGEGFGKKKGANGRNRGQLEPKGFWRNSNYIRGGFWGVYMNSSNLIYVVIIFLKLKIY